MVCTESYFDSMLLFDVRDCGGLITMKAQTTFFSEPTDATNTWGMYSVGVHARNLGGSFGCKEVRDNLMAKDGMALWFKVPYLPCHDDCHPSRPSKLARGEYVLKSSNTRWNLSDFNMDNDKFLEIHPKTNELDGLREIQHLGTHPSSSLSESAVVTAQATLSNSTFNQPQFVHTPDDVTLQEIYPVLQGERREFSAVVVDEIASIRRMLSQVLVSAGATSVMTFSNGRDACEFLVENNPDIVFLDLGLSQMNGFQVCITY